MARTAPSARRAPAPARATVLVWHSGISDPLTGGHYTLKVYTSKKAISGDDTWRHVRVTLKPLNPDFEEITLTPVDEDDVRVIGEFVSVLTT